MEERHRPDADTRAADFIAEIHGGCRFRGELRVAKGEFDIAEVGAASEVVQVELADVAHCAHAPLAPVRGCVAHGEAGLPEEELACFLEAADLLDARILGAERGVDGYAADTERV